MPHRFARPLSAALAAAVVLPLVACSDSQDAAQNNSQLLAQEASSRTAAIGVDPDSTEQRVLGEIYRQLLMSLGYDAGLADVDERAEPDPVDQLRTDDLDIVVACTGPLLERRDAGAASQVGTSGKEGQELIDATYDALVGTLPGEISTVDPSPAQGCGQEGSEGHEDPKNQQRQDAGHGAGRAGERNAGGGAELPTNIIPLFVDGKFDRWPVYRINFITRIMSTGDLEELTERVDDGESTSAVASEWLREQAGINSPGEPAETTDATAQPQVNGGV